MNGIQNALNPAGPHAASLSNLWWLMFWVCSAVYVLVLIGLAIAIKNGRRETDLNPVLNPRPKTERRMRNVVLSATIVTVAILFVFLLSSFQVGRSLTADIKNKNGLSIEVTGRQ
ncbi:MAG TPA: hypothetical protein VGD38_09610, partial [Pyrinomonadaceae bacterium]